MKKPKSLDIWIIVKNVKTNTKVIWYGSFNEFIECAEYEYEEGADGWIEVPFENWLSEDLAEIFGNELEDCNYHSWTWLPNALLQNLKTKNVSETNCFYILLDMYEHWYHN